MIDETCSTCGGTGSTQHLTSFTYGDGSYEDQPCPGCYGRGFARSFLKPENLKKVAKTAMKKVMDAIQSGKLRKRGSNPPGACL